MASDLCDRGCAFGQTPQDKLAFIAMHAKTGHHVLMVGDGLNDSGALAAADVGITVSDDTACIVPACDAVVAGDRVADLPIVSSLRQAGQRGRLRLFSGVGALQRDRPDARVEGQP